MSLRRHLVSQFARPRGLLGEIAGSIMAHRPSNMRRNIWTVELLQLMPSHEVLELGCGPGFALGLCAEQLTSGHVIGYDHSTVMVRQARRRLSGFVQKGRVDVRLGSLDELALLVGQFDRIFSLNVIQFVPDQQRLFHVLRHCLRANGLVATTYQPRTPNPSREQALEMAARIEMAMQEVGFGDFRRYELSLNPVPAVCVTGRLP